MSEDRTSPGTGTGTGWQVPPGQTGPGTTIGTAGGTGAATDPAATTAALPIPSSAGEVGGGAPAPSTGSAERTGSFAVPDASRSGQRGPGPAAAAGSYQWGAAPPLRAAPESAAAPPPTGRRAVARPAGPRRAQLSLQRIDPWSVFKVAVLLSLLLAVVLLVATTVLYAALSALGVLSALDKFAGELGVVPAGQSLLSLSTVLGAAALLALADVVLVTVLSTLFAFLYNVCGALTGGISVTLSERD